MSRPRPRRPHPKPVPIPDEYAGYDTETLRALLQERIDWLRTCVEWKRQGRPQPGPVFPSPSVAQRHAAVLPAAHRQNLAQVDAASPAMASAP